LVHSAAPSNSTTAMKLHADKSEVQTITAYGAGWIAVNGERYTESLLLASSGERRVWNCNRFEALQSADFDQLAELAAEKPELVVFGSGERLRFVRPLLLQGLMQQRIGVETMDTGAACRTFNILAAEGRRVVVALLQES
jgi:uncharacterized protein